MRVEIPWMRLEFLLVLCSLLVGCCGRWPSLLDRAAGAVGCWLLAVGCSSNLRAEFFQFSELCQPTDSSKSLNSPNSPTLPPIQIQLLSQLSKLAQAHSQLYKLSDQLYVKAFDDDMMISNEFLTRIYEHKGLHE
jgi:hypothetical protein